MLTFIVFFIFHQLVLSPLTIVVVSGREAQKRQPFEFDNAYDLMSTYNQVGKEGSIGSEIEDGFDDEFDDSEDSDDDEFDDEFGSEDYEGDFDSLDENEKGYGINLPAICQKDECIEFDPKNFSFHHVDIPACQHIRSNTELSEDQITEITGYTLLPTIYNETNIFFKFSQLMSGIVERVQPLESKCQSRLLNQFLDIKKPNEFNPLIAALFRSYRTEPRVRFSVALKKWFTGPFGFEQPSNLPNLDNKRDSIELALATALEYFTQYEAPSRQNLEYSSLFESRYIRSFQESSKYLKYHSNQCNICATEFMSDGGCEEKCGLAINEYVKNPNKALSGFHKTYDPLGLRTKTTSLFGLQIKKCYKCIERTFKSALTTLCPPRSEKFAESRAQKFVHTSEGEPPKESGLEMAVLKVLKDKQFLNDKQEHRAISGGR